MFKFIRNTLFLFVAVLSAQAQASLEIVITEGIDSARPIAILPFTFKEGKELNTIISKETINQYLEQIAILLVEIMDQLRDEGHSIDSAIREGASLRLRPIAMTVLSTLLGVVPLVLTSGPGAEAREAIAWVVLGGLGLSTLFTLYLAPMGYSFLAPYMKPRAHAGEMLEKEIEAHEAALKKGEVQA